eukprot:3409501-Pyramimonas_sp.AAC.1
MGPTRTGGMDPGRLPTRGRRRRLSQRPARAWCRSLGGFETGVRASGGPSERQPLQDPAEPGGH